jgi:methylamine--corrinoid protein Co-methyltransferase
MDHITPMNGRWSAQIAHAVVGMKRDEANEIVKQLLTKYEDNLHSAPKGLKFWECYDMKTLKPFKEHEELYVAPRQELESYGVKLRF